MALRNKDFDNDASTNRSVQIAFDIAPALLHRIEKIASQKNLSIGDYLEFILEQAVPDEGAIQEVEQQQAGLITQEGIDRLRQIREQIIQRRNGQLFENTAEEIRQMREERTQYLEEL